MSNPQKIKFRNIDDFLSYLPEEELVIVEYLREIVLDCIPDGREKLSYNVPFYYKNARICFIWPASVPWGKVEKGVALGFCQAQHLSTVIPDVGTKNISKQLFLSLKDIEVDQLRSQLYEAVVVDEELAAQKPPKR